MSVQLNAEFIQKINLYRFRNFLSFFYIIQSNQTSMFLNKNTLSIYRNPPHLMEKDKQSRKLYYSSTVTNFSLTPWNIGEINFHNCLVTSNSVIKYCRIRYHCLLLDFLKLLFLKNGFVWYFLLVASRLRTSIKIFNQVHYMYWWISVYDVKPIL